MSNVGARVRTRKSHQMVTRASHDTSGYYSEVNDGAAYAADQSGRDEVFGEQNLMPGAVGSGQIRDDALLISKFTSDIRPVAIVGVLPTLPHEDYPVGSYVVLTSDGRLYKNVADAWVLGVDGADIVADSITAGQIAAGAISTSEIAAGAIQADKIGVGQIDGTHMSGDPKNLVPNPGGEAATVTGQTTLQGWTLTNTDIRLDGALMRSGKAVFQSVSPSSSPYNACVSGYLPVQGSRRYRARVWVSGYFANGATTEGTLQLTWYDQTQAQISTSVIGSVTKGNNATFTEISGTVSAPATAVWVRVLAIASTVATNDRLYWDDFEVELADQDIDHAGGNVVINSDGITINNGALILQDEFAKTVMVASGFSGAWQDYVQLGLYNARFLSGTTGTIPNGRTSALPYWTVSNVAGSPTATLLSGGTVQVTFPVGLSDRKRLMSDKVPVRPDVEYSVPIAYYNQVIAGSVLFDTTIFWYKADGSAASVASSFLATAGVNTGGVIRNEPLFIALAPIDAAYASVEIEIYQSGTHNPGNYMVLTCAGLREVPTRVLWDTITTGKSWKMDNLGVVGYLGAGGLMYLGGTAFPAGDLDAQFYRTDLKMNFVYDGTRWVSTELFHAQALIGVTSGGTIPYTATTASGIKKVSLYAAGGSNMLLERVVLTFHVQAGTALGASHKWVGTHTRNPSATAIPAATLNVDSGASTTWRQLVVTPNVLIPTTDFEIDVTWTKTGTPGNLYAFEDFYYRIVAT